MTTDQHDNSLEEVSRCILLFKLHNYLLSLQFFRFISLKMPVRTSMHQMPAGKDFVTEHTCHVLYLS
jgi:hypothetical protein